MGELALILFWFHFITLCIIPLANYISVVICDLPVDFTSKGVDIWAKKLVPIDVVCFSNKLFLWYFLVAAIHKSPTQTDTRNMQVQTKILVCGIDSLFFWSCTWSWPWIRFALVDRHGVRDIIIFRFSCQAHIIFFTPCYLEKTNFLLF